MYDKNGRFIIIDYENVKHTKDDAKYANLLGNYKGKNKLSPSDLDNTNCIYITTLEKVVDLHTGSKHYQYSTQNTSSPS